MMKGKQKSVLQDTMWAFKSSHQKTEVVRQSTETGQCSNVLPLELIYSHLYISLPQLPVAGCE